MDCESDSQKHMTKRKGQRRKLVSGRVEGGAEGDGGSKQKRKDGIAIKKRRAAYPTRREDNAMEMTRVQSLRRKRMRYIRDNLHWMTILSEWGKVIQSAMCSSICSSGHLCSRKVN